MMVEAKKYNKEFFKNIESNSSLSAKHMLPVVNSLLSPKSVIDIGCGTGEWLNVWLQELNISDLRGVEGPYLSPEQLNIDRALVVFHDLKNVYSENRRYDLAMSLEVGEHLPVENAENLVRTLTGLSDAVLFSAAVPGQEGTYHINEQYPEFWASLFQKYDYVPVDAIRSLIWDNDNIEYWYRQNSILYIHKDKLSAYPGMKDIRERLAGQPLVRIHPKLLEIKNNTIRQTSTLAGLINWKWVKFKYRYFKKS